MEHLRRQWRTAAANRLYVSHTQAGRMQFLPYGGTIGTGPYDYRLA